MTPLAQVMNSTWTNLKNNSDNEKININVAVSALNLDVDIDSLDDVSVGNIEYAYRRYTQCLGCSGKVPVCVVPYQCTVSVENNQVKCTEIKCILKQAWEIMRASGVPSRYIGKRTFDYKLTPQNQSAARAALNCINSNNSLYLFGGVRAGKTFLSCIICNERAFLGKKSLFVTVTDLMDTLYNFSDSFQRNEALNRYKKVRCLVIDDLGAEYSTDFSAATLFSIIDYRYKNNLQTIINSNFSLDELATHLHGYQGDRISRRIADFCSVVSC